MFFQAKCVFKSCIQRPVIFFILALVTASGAALSPATQAEESLSLVHQESLDSIYLARGNRPIWVSVDGGLNSSGSALISILRSAAQDGLRPSDYHDEVLSNLMDNSYHRTPFIRAAASEGFEFLLTDACLSYGLDLSRGRIDPDLVYSRWDNKRKSSDILETLVDMLVTAPAVGEEPCFDPVGALNRIRPDDFDYQRLKIALAYYRFVAQSGGWPSIPGGEILRTGHRNHRVSLLRARLTGIAGPDSGNPSLLVPVSPWSWFAGYFPLALATAEPDLFDDGLATAVRSFQKRHGLQCDGLVGDKTLAALNESAGHKADRIALNMERIRWLPEEPADPFIRVNLPSCRLDLMELGQSVLSMKTVVGRPDRPTPVMVDQIRWLELNPYWNVPQKLVRKDILPKVIEDPQYLRDRDFHVFETWKPGAEEIDVDAVDWSGLNSWDIAFRFRQDPGPRNPLGRMKFLFPNRFSIYLHDTIQRDFFARDSRCLSSGCVRLEDADGLAHLLVPEEDYSTSLESRENRTIGLPEKVPVFIVYQTVWIDNSGRVNFAPDIYGYDARMRNIMADEGKETLVAN